MDNDINNIPVNTVAFFISFFEVMSAFIKGFDPYLSFLQQPILYIIFTAVSIGIWWLYKRLWKAASSVLLFSIITFTIAYPIEANVRVYSDEGRDGEFIEGLDTPLAFIKTQLKDVRGVIFNKTSDKNGIIKYHIDASGPVILIACRVAIQHEFSLFTKEINHPIPKKSIQDCDYLIKK